MMALATEQACSGGTGAFQASIADENEGQPTYRCLLQLAQLWPESGKDR